MVRIAVFALALSIPTISAAGPIERACLRADRPAATRSLCGCIQVVASATLSKSDQRRAAKFFKDPHKAQETRQSDRAALEAFWQRYKRFTASAEATCS